jgi:hypothetical protein
MSVAFNHIQSHTHTHTHRHTQTHTDTHTHIHLGAKNPLEKELARCWYVYLRNTKYSQRTYIHAHPGIQTLNTSKGVAAILTL